MGSRRKFSHLQLGIAGLIGSPIAIAALASWNLIDHGKHVAGLFFVACISAIAALDVLVGQTNSQALGVFSFLTLVLLLMTANYLLTRRDKESIPQSWGYVGAVIVCALILAVLLRIVSR